VTIILDTGFAILDRGQDGGLTQRRRGAEPPRDFCRTSFGRILGSIRQTVPDAFGLCAFVASRLCVEIHATIQLCAVKVATLKSHTRNQLMLNALKPGQTQSNHCAGSDRLTQIQLTSNSGQPRLTQLTHVQLRSNSLKWALTQITHIKSIFLNESSISNLNLERTSGIQNGNLRGAVASGLQLTPSFGAYVRLFGNNFFVSNLDRDLDHLPAAGANLGEAKAFLNYLVIIN
jgi:hypothetical protein